MVGHQIEAVQRCAVRDFTFKDGFKIPRNTWMFFLNRELFFDQDIYENPEKFDPWRSLKMKSEDGSQKHLFSTVSDTSLHFGAGNQACPGRFFSSHEIKMILIHFLTRYELGWPKKEEYQRPPDAIHDYSTHPDRTKTVMLKEKVM
jgi:cytochrome P450